MSLWLSISSLNIDNSPCIEIAKILRNFSRKKSFCLKYLYVLWQYWVSIFWDTPIGRRGKGPSDSYIPSRHILWNNQNLHHHYQHNHHYHHHYKRSPILIILPASAPTVFAVAAVVALSAWAENLVSYWWLWGLRWWGWWWGGGWWGWWWRCQATRTCPSSPLKRSRCPFSYFRTKKLLAFSPRSPPGWQKISFKESPTKDS